MIVIKENNGLQEAKHIFNGLIDIFTYSFGVKKTVVPEKRDAFTRFFDGHEVAVWELGAWTAREITNPNILGKLLNPHHVMNLSGILNTPCLLEFFKGDDQAYLIIDRDS
jgi:hypothetical protein